MYHVNTETGKVGTCRAVHNCPFGAAAHHNSPEQARQYFEHLMGKVWLVDNSQDEFLRQRYLHRCAQFENDLTEQEIQTLKAYADQDYHDINENLRERIHDDRVAIIDDALAKGPQISNVLYRKCFLGHDEAEKTTALGKFKPGFNFTNAGYSSTTDNVNALIPMLRQKPVPTHWGTLTDNTAYNVVLRYETNLGAPIGLAAHMPQEREWLLPRSLQCEVVEVEETVLETDCDLMGNYQSTPLQRPVTVVKVAVRSHQ